MTRCLSSAVCLFTRQGPPGKDGLPGHPGQRGETVSGPIFVSECPVSCHMTLKKTCLIAHTPP